jgi:hypothetical protein
MFTITLLTGGLLIFESQKHNTYIERLLIQFLPAVIVLFDHSVFQFTFPITSSRIPSKSVPVVISHLRRQLWSCYGRWTAGTGSAGPRPNNSVDTNKTANKNTNKNTNNSNNSNKNINSSCGSNDEKNGSQSAANAPNHQQQTFA